LRKLPYWLANGAEMAKLYFTPAIRSEQFQPSVR
jgi:magnesium-protoporphyrin IX monomethyl ester (oxidative) cyclase